MTNVPARTISSHVIDDEDLLKFKTLTKADLPQAMLRFYRHSNGLALGDGGLIIQLKNRKEIQIVEVFPLVDPGKRDAFGVAGISELPAHLFPIADTAHGDLLVISLRVPDFGYVYSLNKTSLWSGNDENECLELAFESIEGFCAVVMRNIGIGQCDSLRVSGAEHASTCRKRPFAMRLTKSAPSISLHEAQIACLRNGLSLPDDYLRFILCCNGGIPGHQQVFDVNGRREGVSFFFPLIDENGVCPGVYYRELSELPGGLFPVGHDAFGNYLVLGLDKENFGVFFVDNDDYWSGDRKTDGIFKVADTFQGFLDSLIANNGGVNTDTEEPWVS